MVKKTRPRRPDVSRDELVPRLKRSDHARGENGPHRPVLRGDKESSPDVYYWPQEALGGHADQIAGRSREANEKSRGVIVRMFSLVGGFPPARTVPTAVPPSRKLPGLPFLMAGGFVCSSLYGPETPGLFPTSSLGNSRVPVFEATHASFRVI